MACPMWARRLAAPVLVAVALVAAALPAPAAAAPLMSAALPPLGGGAPPAFARWLAHAPRLPSWPRGAGGRDGMAAGISYTAVIANNCDDLSFSVCAAYGGESEYALFRFNADHTGSAIGRVSLTVPGVGRVTDYGVLHITRWVLQAPGNPWADFFAVPDPTTPEFYAKAGTMDLTVVTPAGTTHEDGLPLGLPFIESGTPCPPNAPPFSPCARLTLGATTYPQGDTGVTLLPGLTRITTLYPPLSGSASPVQVPADVPLYLLVTEHR